MKSKELVTIATFNEPFVAHLARGKLESHGINCYLGNENIVGTFWLYANAVGGVQLQVEKVDAELALALLNEKVADNSGGKAEKEHSLCCPNCLSREIRELPKTGYEWTWYILLVSLLTILTMALIWIVMGLWIIQKKKWKCNQCGYEWKQRERPFPT